MRHLNITVMALKCIVKLNNTQNLSEARFAAGMEANLIGFDMSEEGGITSLTKAREIIGWLEGIETVAEIEHAGPEWFAKIRETINPSWVETSHLATAVLAKELGFGLVANLPYTPEVEELEQWFELAPTYFHLPNCLEEDMFSTLTEILEENYPAIIGYTGTDESLINQLLNDYPSIGFSVNSKPEEKPGLVDNESLSVLLETLEIEG